MGPSSSQMHGTLWSADVAGPLAGLSDQERTVLDLIGEGLTNRQIGERMFLAEKTVKNYVSHVLAKLGMERRTQAAILSTELKGDGFLVNSACPGFVNTDMGGPMGATSM